MVRQSGSGGRCSVLSYGLLACTFGSGTIAAKAGRRGSKQEICNHRCTQMHTDAHRWDNAHRIGTAAQVRL